MINALTLFIGLFTLFIVGSLTLLEQSYLFFFLALISFVFSAPILVFFNKIKFFLLAILLIFSLSVPGEIIFFYDFISISREGIELAIFNVLRLSNIFLIVFLLMRKLSRSFIIENIIKACLFLTVFGVKKERLIARVFLTFEYLEFYRKEQFKFRTLSKDIGNQINTDFSKKVNPKIEQIEFKFQDYLWIIVFISSLSVTHIFLL
tara:strand:+ start:42326 stop:42943 length:618 start_codon:yes stop_codon:yes gene_type:complete